MLGAHLVAEPFVESLVSRKLAAHPDPNLDVTLVVGVGVDPRHQRRPNAVSLPGGIDRDPSDVQSARFAIEPQATDRAPIEEGERPA